MATVGPEQGSPGDNTMVPATMRDTTEDRSRGLRRDTEAEVHPDQLSNTQDPEHQNDIPRQDLPILAPDQKVTEEAETENMKANLLLQDKITAVKAVEAMATLTEEHLLDIVESVFRNIREHSDS